MGNIDRLEEKLERLKVEEEIADSQRIIAERRALEKDAKKRHGRGWRTIVGTVGKIKPDQEAIQTLYSQNPELKELTRPGKLRRL